MTCPPFLSATIKLCSRAGAYIMEQNKYVCINKKEEIGFPISSLVTPPGFKPGTF